MTQVQPTGGRAGFCETVNIHERDLEADPAAVGALIDSLSSREDRLWPKHAWPRMAFDRPLGVGARGGHGPIRYVVEAYTPGQSIRFRFTGPKSFNGVHGYELARGRSEHSSVLRHTLKMTTHGLAMLSWPLVYRPMHDALLEDSLTLSQASLGLAPEIRPWSLWVKMLRWGVSGGKAGPKGCPAHPGRTRPKRATTNKARRNDFPAACFSCIVQRAFRPLCERSMENQDLPRRLFKGMSQEENV